MNTSTEELDAMIKDVSFNGDQMTVALADGRRFVARVSTYPRLAQATEAQRTNWQLCAAGTGIHWPEIDEDLSAAGLLRSALAGGS